MSENRDLLDHEIGRRPSLFRWRERFRSHRKVVEPGASRMGNERQATPSDSDALIDRIPSASPIEASETTLQPPRNTGQRQPDDASEEPDDRWQSFRASLRQDQFRGVIEAHIDRAQRRGDFDNLKGKGKPLDMREQPGEADGTWAISRVAVGAGLTLPWIALAKEIDEDLAACRTIADRLPMAARLRRADLLEEYRQRARGAKAKTARYNLMVPSMQLQRFVVDAEGMITDVERTVDALNSR